MRDDDERTARGLGDGVARIIPLRRSALGPTADRLQRLALDAGVTLTELVATADTHTALSCLRRSVAPQPLCSESRWSIL